MKKFTVGERANIYLEAARIVSECSYYACLTIMEVGDIDLNDNEFEVLFSEFMLFSEEKGYNGRRWWDKNIEGDNCRVLALLFAHQMAKNP